MRFDPRLGSRASHVGRSLVFAVFGLAIALVAAWGTLFDLPFDGNLPGNRLPVAESDGPDRWG